MRGRKVIVTPPLNVSSHDIHLFEDKLEYLIEPLKVLSLKNVFIGYTGFCLTKNGLVKECHHDYPDQLENYANEIYNYYKRAKRNEEDLIIFDDLNTYLLIHHPWHNYYHWICEVILRLWLVKDKTQSLVLVLPERVKYEDWARSSLKPFLFKEIFYIPSQKSVLVKNLLMPQIKPDCHSYYREELLKIKEYYLTYMNEKEGVTTDFGKKIYISRKKASRRKISNEKQVVEILMAKGFKVISNEDYNFFEQMSIFSNATMVISIHGAGLTNMIWMVEGSKVLEFHKKQTNSKDRHSLVYWYLADSLGHKYFQQVCNPIDEEADFFIADMIVDTELLKKNLILMGV